MNQSIITSMMLYKTKANAARLGLRLAAISMALYAAFSLYAIISDSSVSGMLGSLCYALSFSFGFISLGVLAAIGREHKYAVFASVWAVFYLRFVSVIMVSAFESIKNRVGFYCDILSAVSGLFIFILLFKIWQARPEGLPSFWFVAGFAVICEPLYAHVFGFISMELFFRFIRPVLYSTLYGAIWLASAGMMCKNTKT